LAIAPGKLEPVAVVEDVVALTDHKKYFAILMLTVLETGREHNGLSVTEAALFLRGEDRYPPALFP
jgi:hypothetical protein